MPVLSFSRTDLPFLLGGSTSFAVDTGDLQVNRPLNPATESLLKVSLKATGTQKAELGQSSTVKLGLSAATSVTLTPVFATSKGASSKLLTTYGLAGFFKDRTRAETVVLVFEAGVSAAVAAAGSFRYSMLKAGVAIDAGADASYAFLMALDRTMPLERLLATFVKAMRLPEQAEAGSGRALAAGEAISLAFGGYLKIGAEVSAGYKLSGSKSMAIGGLSLSERYRLDIVGRVGLSANIAGRFSVLMTAADLDGWTRVQVRRHQAKSLAIAADVSVGAKSELDLPASSDEFLGAVLGVRAKSFLAVLHKARELSDFEKLKEATDGLARRFISELIGKGFDTLSNRTQFDRFLARVNTIVTSYEQVDDRAIALFDRYFDRIDVLDGFLDRISQLEANALDRVRQELTPELWNILSQLTDGDPLGFLLERVTVGGVELDRLAELRKRAAAVRALIVDDAHKEIRDVVALAKASFGLDSFFRELAKIDTVEELQALASSKTGEFVSRLVGRTLDSATNLKAALDEIRAVLENIDGFKDQLFKTFKAATNSSYKLALHAEYSRATEKDALVDVMIRPGHPRGKDLLRQAGQGDFEEILTTVDSDLVRLREGVFTHKTTRQRAFSVNIVGWHLDYRYSGLDRVITEASQRLVPSKDGGGITVLTTLELDVTRTRTRKDEEVHTNLLLRALGESAGVVAADPSNTTFLVDALASLTASYALAFTDEHTSGPELDDYLAFARELGLDTQGATRIALEPVLPRAADGGFGSVKATYDVRFDARSVAALLKLPKLTGPAEQAIRTAMRRIVLSNYLKSEAMHDAAFAYATPAVFDQFRELGFAAFINGFERVFRVSLGDSGVKAPATVVLDRTERQLVATLYDIETAMVKAIRGFYDLLRSGKKMDPVKFEARLGDFGDAMLSFDRFDQTSNAGGVGTTSLFVMFDALVRLATKDTSGPIAVLRLESGAAGKSVEKVFMSDAAATA